MRALNQMEVAALLLLLRAQHHVRHRAWQEMQQHRDHASRDSLSSAIALEEAEFGDEASQSTIISGLLFDVFAIVVNM